jgi:hypothetical protein
VVLPGAVVGTAAGVLSAIAAMAVARVLGHGAADPLKLVAGMFLRHLALDRMGLGSACLGIVVHLAIAVALATGYAFALPRGGATAVAAIGIALVGGMAMWAIGYELLLDFLNPLMASSVPGLALLPFLLLFSACLPAVVPFRRALDRFARSQRSFAQS